MFFNKNKQTFGPTKNESFNNTVDLEKPDLELQSKLEPNLEPDLEPDSELETKVHPVMSAIILLILILGLFNTLFSDPDSVIGKWLNSIFITKTQKFEQELERISKEEKQRKEQALKTLDQKSLTDQMIILQEALSDVENDLSYINNLDKIESAVAKLNDFRIKFEKNIIKIESEVNKNNLSKSYNYLNFKKQADEINKHYVGLIESYKLFVLMKESGLDDTNTSYYNFAKSLKTNLSDPKNKLQDKDNELIVNKIIEKANTIHQLKSQRQKLIKQNGDDEIVGDLEQDIFDLEQEMKSIIRTWQSNHFYKSNVNQFSFDDVARSLGRELSKANKKD